MIWHVIYIAQSNRGARPTSPSIAAPATKNDSHEWSFSHMERHLHRAGQQASPSNGAKYCARQGTWRHDGPKYEKFAEIQHGIAKQLAELLFPSPQRILYVKIKPFALRLSTQIGCYFNELLLDWTVTLLSCYLT